MISYLITSLKKYKLNAHLKSISQYVKVGDSHFYPSFQLIMCGERVPGSIQLAVGDNNILDCKILLETSGAKVIVGNNNWIGSSTIVCKTQIEIGDNVFISWGGYFSDHDSHSINYQDREHDIVQQLENHKNGRFLLADKNWDVVNTKPIKICSNVWIGMNCIILKGVTIGQGAVVAAGSVVTKDVAPWTVVGGNPAVLLKELPENLRKK